MPLNVVLIIPAYSPDVKLIQLLTHLICLETRFLQIIVVDDGSSIKYAAVFQKIRQLSDRVTILQHAVNLGKGAALKTAFNYALLNFPVDTVGVVTADADGQHSPKDIASLAIQLQHDSEALHLGVRGFRDDVPFRSKIGNSATSFLVRLLLHRKISDTQTGLRGIPRAMLQQVMRIKSNGYELEFEMLATAIHSNRRIIETKIDTIYIDGNRSSHFNPLLDSLRIYFVFCRFLSGSILTALIDYAVFTAAYLISVNIITSLVVARMVAGTFNFSVNRHIVFKSHGRFAGDLVKYVMTVLFFTTISYWIIHAAHSLFEINVYVAKIAAEGTLFLVSFAIQSRLVFTRSNGE